MLVIFWFFQNGADDSDWWPLGGGGVDPDCSCLSTHNGGNCGEAKDGSDIVE